MPFEQIHGDGTSTRLPLRRSRLFLRRQRVSDDQAAAQLAGLDVWIVDALRHEPHPSHFSVGQALAWIERLKPRRAILTHMHNDLDYATLKRALPEDVEPAYDGMPIAF